MKRAILIIIKLSLLVFFLHNIGLFSFFANFEPNEAPPIKGDGGRADLEYLNEKEARAVDLGGNYGPEEYFADLTDIQLREDNNDFDRNVIMNVYYSKSRLNDLFRFNLQRKRANLSGDEYQAYMNRLENARDKHLETVDPGYKQRQEESLARTKEPGYWSGLLLKLLKFLGKFYWKNLWLAFVLLWVWWYQEKKKIKVDNPLSFIFCLIIYPVVIIRTWRKILSEGTRFWAMTVELRSREMNLFSLFSQDEIAELKKLAKSNIKLSEFRKNLDQAGLIRRHSLVSAMTITSIFLLLPKISDAKNDFQIISSFGDSTREICLLINSPPVSDINQTSLLDDDDYNNGFHYFPSPMGLMTESILIFFVNIFSNKIPLLIEATLTGFKTDPEPIPIFC